MSARASIVVSLLARLTARFDESQGIRGQRMLLSLLLFFAFLVCASMHKVAQARALGLSTEASAQTHDGDSSAARLRTRFDEAALLGPLSSAPQCAEDHAAPPVSELDAIETEDTDQNARVDTLSVELSVALSQVRPDVGQAPPVVAQVATDKLSVVSALPRGPPNTHR